MDSNFNKNEEETNYGNYSFTKEEPNNEKKKKKKSGILFWIILSALLIGVSTGTGVYVGNRISNTNKTIEATNLENKEDKKEETRVSISTTADTAKYVSNSSDVSDVVENVMPSIVSINNGYTLTNNYFGRSYSTKGGGSGSGIIIGQNDDEILIVTNNHVIKAMNGASDQKITVTFDNDKTVDAKIKGTDAAADLAVLSVTIKDIDEETLSKIKIATLGDSTKMKVGQMVIAIGNALGYGQSTTVGYVSALDREIADEDYTMKLIQTDAAINPGNSGGALINAKGEVIGINSVKYSSESIEGMGFSIPISTALPIINDLMNKEEIKDGEQSYLGILGQNVTKNHNEIYGMPIGVYIQNVTDSSPAAKAGLKMGQIIVGFNSHTIRSMSDLQSRLSYVKAGTVVTLKIKEYSNGEYVDKKITVTLGKRPTENREEGRRGNENNEHENRNEIDPFNYFFRNNE